MTNKNKDSNHTGGINNTLVMGILIGLFLGAVGASLYFHFSSSNPEIVVWADGFFQNFGTEMFGAFLTFLLIEVLLARRRAAEAKRIAAEERKEAMILQMGSHDSAFALEATRILRSKGWLTDGSLRGASLMRANLQGADLYKANPQEANLWYANLQGAYLRYVNLQRAKYCQTVQLQQARTLKGTILPDGAQLPDDDTWQAVFEEWCKTVAVDENGFIIPAEIDNVDKTDA